MGWDPEYKFFPIPSISQAQSHHVEFEAPEGLQITHARLDVRGAFDRPYAQSPTGSQQPAAEERKQTQRSHLYASQIPAGSEGIARFALRPRESTIVRASALSAGVTTLLLLATRLLLNHIGPNAGSVATLLLVIPGGLSAYVARPREHLIATRMLFGLRLMALAEGLLAVIAAVIVVFSRRWTTSHEVFVAGHIAASAAFGLWVLTAVSAVNTSHVDPNGKTARIGSGPVRGVGSDLGRSTLDVWPHDRT